jgi:hypothetical protein
MAANINHELSTMAASSAVPSEEGTPIVNVSESGNGVMLKWGGDVTHAPHNNVYNIAPYNIHATNTTGREPSFKTFGSLLGCDDGEMTINKTTYRIQVDRQEGPTIGVPPEQTTGKLRCCFCILVFKCCFEYENEVAFSYWEVFNTLGKSVCV